MRPANPMIVRVRGRSMSPTLHPGDFLWVRKPIALQRRQIVLIKHGDDSYLKRIVGLPGEKVEIRNSRVFVNDRALSEPYIPDTAYIQPQSDQAWSLTLDTYLVLGDARDDSLDSRRLGPVPADHIVGAAVCRLWPPKSAL